MALLYCHGLRYSNGVRHPFDTRRNQYRLRVYDRTHILAANYVYDVPGLARCLGGNTVMKGIFDNWQISGITTGQRILGTHSVSPSLYLKSDPGKGSGDLLIDPDAFLIPHMGDAGPYPRTYVRNPGWFNNDISIFKNFPFGGGERRQGHSAWREVILLIQDH